MMSFPPATEKFSLRWNNFQNTLSKTFGLLRSEEEFFDVTLVSDDQQTMSAHKVVLSASSPYFKNVLTRNKHSHPLLCLEGVSVADLSHVLDYIYHGEVLLGQEELDRFVTVASRLQLEGLVVTEEDQVQNVTDIPVVKPSAAKKRSTSKVSNTMIDKGKQKKIKSENDFQNFTIEKNVLLSNEFTGNLMNVSQMDQRINENFFMNPDTSFTCSICAMTKKRLSDIQTHVELHLQLQQPLIPCQSCGNTFRTRNLLSKHLCPVAVAKFT